MAVFVDLDSDDDVDNPQQARGGIKPIWDGMLPPPQHNADGGVSSGTKDREEAHEPAVQEQQRPMVWNSMTVALGCYP